MTQDRVAIQVNAKIIWDSSLDEGLCAIMFNDNGVWFKYSKEVSANRLKTVFRQLSSRVPIRMITVKPLSEIGVENCEYRCVYSDNALIVAKLPQNGDEDDLHFRYLSDNELASLLGSPSRLLADYWDELYVPDNKYSLHLKWDDGNENRDANVGSIGVIANQIESGEHSGTFEQLDEHSGESHSCIWVMLPEIENFVSRALWLGKGNTPEKGC